jgi:hypothetical protein
MTYLIEIPAYAVTSEAAFMDWVMHTPSWDPTPVPTLISCPLCAAVVVADWFKQLVHGEVHMRQVLERIRQPDV